MILCVGDSVKLGHLREALEQRLHQEVTFLPAAPDIRRQENDILLAAQGTDAIIYDRACSAPPIQCRRAVSGPL